MHQGLALVVSEPFQGFGNRLGLAGQIDDQTIVSNDGHLARQNGRGHKAQADLAHLLPKTRHFFVRHGQGGLGRHVAFGRSGATGGQHQIATQVDEVNQRLADQGLFIGDQARLPIDGVLHGTVQPLAQGGQAFVFVDAAGGAVADGDDANANTVQGG